MGRDAARRRGAPAAPARRPRIPEGQGLARQALGFLEPLGASARSRDKGVNARPRSPAGQMTPVLTDRVNVRQLPGPGCILELQERPPLGFGSFTDPGPYFLVLSSPSPSPPSCYKTVSRVLSVNDLIHKAGVMTVCRAKWALNCVSNKSATKVNRGKRVWEGKEVGYEKSLSQ